MKKKLSGLHRPALWAQVLLITMVFSGFYYVLSHLPSAQCDFLHYEVAEVLSDGTEVCAATNHARFIDLDALSYPVEMILHPQREPVAGREMTFELELLGRHGNPMLPHELAVTHTERIHLMAVDASLGDYHHMHPQPLGNSGKYKFTMNPKAGGKYRFYADFVPVRTRRQVVASGSVQVSGEPAKAYKKESGAMDTPRTASWKQYEFELIVDDGRLRKNRDNRMALRVHRKDGAEVELEETMGAQAHLVAFDSDKTGFAHMHPSTLEPATGATPEVPFLFFTPKRGPHRIWAQVKLHGDDVFVPFDVEVL